MSNLTVAFVGNIDTDFSPPVNGMVVESRGVNGFLSHLDLQHYLRVKEARDRQGLTRPNVVAHHLTGCNVVDTVTGEMWHIESVRKSWWIGTHLTAVMTTQSKDGLRTEAFCIDALNNCLPQIRRMAECNRARFGLN